MKKLLALAVVAGGVLFAVKRNKDAKAEADLWREATTAPGAPAGGSSVNGVNGAAPAKTSTSNN